MNKDDMVAVKGPLPGVNVDLQNETHRLGRELFEAHRRIQELEEKNKELAVKGSCDAQHIEARIQKVWEVAGETEFSKALEGLLNAYCMENGSDTPDFILASFLLGCLRVFDQAVGARERWYGRKPVDVGGPVDES